MIRALVLIPTLLAFSLVLPGRALVAAEPHSRRMHEVLYDIKAAIKDVKEDKKFDKHKKKALEDLQFAAKQIEEGLEFAKDPWDPKFVPSKEHKGELNKYKNFKELRHAEVSIERGITELKEAKGWGEHKKKATEALEKALVQVKICVKDL